MTGFYDCIPCVDLNEFVKKYLDLPQSESHSWIFRGQREAYWDLKTSLERECQRFGICGNEVFRREYNMVREFRRRLHQYETNVPGRDNVDEWMGLMQHYGAPTRLLDFTYSPYVAAYFAFENTDSEQVAVWAIDAGLMHEKLMSLKEFQDLHPYYEKYANYRDPVAFRKLFLSNLDRQYVLSVNPFRLSDRLTYQQALFLCPASVSVGFMENLRTLINLLQDDHLVKKYTIECGKEGEQRNDALNSLYSMNINRSTLFPGLISFAESFKVGLKTVFGEHKVMDNGEEMPVEELWEKLSESPSD